MSDIEKRFHETWLGMTQPSEGLVVSIPALIEAQCLERQPAQVQDALAALAYAKDGAPCVKDLCALFERVLDLDAPRFDGDADLPADLQLYVPEGRQTLRPTLGLKGQGAALEGGADAGAAARAGRGYRMLVWAVPAGLKLDKPETVTGPWDYPPGAKFDRLLRACRVPIGLLSNGHELRLYYAPHGESTGWLSFRVADMCTVGGRPILDAFCMLLGRQRWFGVAAERQLPALLEDSRRKQAGVTNQLAEQVFAAMEDLLAGFAGAADRDGDGWLREALSREDDHLYGGLLTTLLRLVFVLYCEDRGLLPVESKLYGDHFSVLGLFDQLQQDYALFPDSMGRRFGAYGRLVSLFRAVYDGAQHGDLNMPPRRGGLFDPNAYSFLEGWSAGGAPRSPVDRAAVRVPTVDDLTIYRVLEKLLLLDGQRLSYQTLDVEQIGSVYEALMGFSVCRLESGAVRLRIGGKKGAVRVWVEAGPLLQQAQGQRGRWLQDEYGFDNATSGKLAKAVEGCDDEAGVLAALEGLGGRKPEVARMGGLVVQPGPERRRTSSHYTPRSLTEPIVSRTLDPLIATMGAEPGSEALLSLVICDPAMGSGAFLVAACRYLADHVVAAWTRENRLEKIADAHDDVVNHARRLVAQRCLYGVDKNGYAVQLARLSLWLVTMARNEPFTFVDHALRHGDSLVGLDFDQIRAFHWEPGKQVDMAEVALREALDEAVAIRKQILDLAGEGSLGAQRAKERLLFDAQDALDRVRLIGDVVVGAFFASDSAKDREKERLRRLDLVQRWLVDGDDEAEAELRGLQVALREECKPAVVPFHWMVEFPEVFYAERPDPLNGGKVTGGAFVDGFVGNPPFAGKNRITEIDGPLYLSWLQVVHAGAHGNADLSAHFFRRAARLLGKHGTLGLIATNTIGQGDTRATGLQHLVKSGFVLYGADVDMKWPGDAAVTVSVVHAAHGNPARAVGMRLNGAPVGAINSQLKGRPERADAKVLAANAGLSFVGTYVLGMGFTLTLEERDALVQKDPRNAERIFPYLGGEEVNTSPTQSHHRYVISFGQMTLEEAEAWPDLIAIVREKVKPERDRNNRETYKKFWWHFGEKRPALYEAIAPLERCLVTSAVSKHRAFSFVSPQSIFSHNVLVFPLSDFFSLGVLQSRLHISWATLLSSSLEDRSGYRPSDCLDTFAFPNRPLNFEVGNISRAAESLWEARRSAMLQRSEGLTKLYNALKDPENADPEVSALRQFHEDLDRAVLHDYGWSDIPVPPYCPLTEADHQAVQAFEDEVLDRLFLLNAQRAEEEELQGRSEPSSKKKSRPPSGRLKAKGDSAEPLFELRKPTIHSREESE